MKPSNKLSAAYPSTSTITSTQNYGRSNINNRTSTFGNQLAIHDIHTMNRKASMGKLIQEVEKKKAYTMKRKVGSNMADL